MQENRLIKFDGRVVEILPDARYRVRFTNGHEVIAHASNNIEGLHLTDLAGERITIEISPGDSTKGRLIFHRGFRRQPQPQLA